MKRWMHCGLAALALSCGGSALAGNSFAGASVYTDQCASCHGVGSMGALLGAPNFARGERLMQPDHVLLNSIKVGKGIMPGFQGVLTDAEILNVISYIRTFQ